MGVGVLFYSPTYVSNAFATPGKRGSADHDAMRCTRATRLGTSMPSNSEGSSRCYSRKVPRRITWLIVPTHAAGHTRGFRCSFLLFLEMAFRDKCDIVSRGCSCQRMLPAMQVEVASAWTLRWH